MRRATPAPIERRRGCAISIHALHEESDLTTEDFFFCWDISIHALHEESDNDYYDLHNLLTHFNPRSP